jgi:hypothetical protein
VSDHVPAASERFVWERDPRESPKAFQAFALYRDLGPDRTLRRVADQLGKSLSLIERWSSAWAWRDRVQAYDAYLDRKMRLEAERQLSEARAEMVGRHSQIAVAALHKVTQRIIGDEKAGVEAVPVDDLTLPELARVFEVFHRAERVSRGVPGDHVVHDVGNAGDEAFRVRDETPDRDGAADVLNVLARAGVLGLLVDSPDEEDDEVIELGPGDVQERGNGRRP